MAAAAEAAQRSEGRSGQRQHQPPQREEEERGRHQPPRCEEERRWHRRRGVGETRWPGGRCSGGEEGTTLVAVLMEGNTRSRAGERGAVAAAARRRQRR